MSAHGLCLLLNMSTGDITLNFQKLDKKNIHIVWIVNDIEVVADRGAVTCSKADLQNYVEQNLTEMNGGKRPVTFEEIVELV